MAKWPCCLLAAVKSSEDRVYQNGSYPRNRSVDREKLFHRIEVVYRQAWIASLVCTSDSKRQIVVRFVSLVGLKVGKKRQLNAIPNANEDNYSARKHLE